jgi:hypothetical protein
MAPQRFQHNNRQFQFGFLANVVLNPDRFTIQYGCETWSLILREEHSLRVLENKVLRTIFGPNTDGVRGGWRKLHNEELHNLYSSPTIIRIMKSRRTRWAGHVARMGRGTYIGYW